MAFKNSQRGDVLIVYTGERLDVANAALLEEQLGTFILNGNRKLILNMADTQYLSSAGIRVLLSIHRKMENNQGRLVLCALQEEVIDVLRVAGFDRMLQICTSEQISFSYFS